MWNISNNYQNYDAWKKKIYIAITLLIPQVIENKKNT